MFHILVVEDNDNTRKLMQAVLSQNGYEPILARDGVEALARIAALRPSEENESGC